MTTPARGSASSISFGVLGPIEAVVNGAAIPVGPLKQRTLLAALLVTPGVAMSAERLAGELWPQDRPPTAAAALQVHVAGLRRVVGERLRTSAAGYQLDATAEDVDSAVFEELVRRARSIRAEDPQVALAHLRAALDLWRGAPFDGVTGGPLIQSAAVRLTELRLRAYQHVAELELALGRHQDVVVDLGGWVAQHPTAEHLVAAYMLALHRCGRSSEALTAYAELVDRLAGELSAEPHQEVAALAAAIRRRDPTIEAAQPHLPSQAGRFIGRREELDRVEALLGEARLLTVTGPGGSGKTRLGVEMARAVAAHYPDGVFMVELAGHPPAPDIDGLAARVGVVVGARETPGLTATASLVQSLAERRMLMILDNCEHVRDAAAALAEQVVARCAGVRMLATSREPLGLPGEMTVPLGGLRVSEPSQPLRDALRSDAVRLFTERTGRARGGAGLRTGEEQLAVELCRRLDGMPLAIELAAARLRAMPLRDLVARLDRTLDLLVGRSPVERHRTMRAAIDWSHELLEPAERTLFRRLSVLVGEFDVAAAAAVGADAEGDEPRYADGVLEPLTRLVERSIVTFDPQAPRPYRLLETMREYAAERLAQAGEDAAARSRHAAFVAQMVQAEPPVDGAAHSQWLAFMGSQHDNVRAALTWCLGDGRDPELALTIATSMWWYWWVTGQMLEGRSWLGRALSAADGTRSALRGKALRAAAALARNSGDLAEARRLGEESLTVFLALEDQAGVISALNNLSITAQGQGDYDASLAYGLEGLRRAERDGPPRAVAAALNNTAGTLRCMGRLDEAADNFERALALFRDLTDRRGEAAALTNLAVVARRRGRLDESRTLAVRFLRLYRELGIAEGQLDAVEAIAYVDAATGDLASAHRLLVIARRERTRLGAPIFTPDEAADRDHAEHLVSAGLDPVAAAAVEASANGTDLDRVVAQLLDIAGDA